MSQAKGILKSNARSPFDIRSRPVTDVSFKELRIGSATAIERDAYLRRTAQSAYDVSREI
jgi:hypothetical protein